MSKNKYSKIHMELCQVKSLEKAQLLCKLIDQMEKEFGIREVSISFTDMFICPDIDLTILANSEEPMEKLIGGLFIKLDKIKYGEHSRYQKVKSTKVETDDRIVQTNKRKGVRRNKKTPVRKINSKRSV